MVSYHAERDRADKLALRVKKAERRADELDRLFNAAIESKRDAELERDCYRAVLLGMEFRDIENYSSYGLNFCYRLGREALKRMKKLAGEL